MSIFLIAVAVLFTALVGLENVLRYLVAGALVIVLCIIAAACVTLGVIFS